MTEDRQLGDAPVEAVDFFNAIATTLDQILNGKDAMKDKSQRKTGFVLLVFPFEGRDGRCNYVSNGANREDIVTLFKEQIAMFESQSAPKQ